MAWLLYILLLAANVAVGVRQEQRAGLWSWSKFVFARIGTSNARPVLGCPPPVARNRPYVASKRRGRVACLGYRGRQ